MKQDDENSLLNFGKLLDLCNSNNQKVGDALLDYKSINKDVLYCYLNMAMCGTCNVRFKEKMVYEKLSDAVTISEEAFALLVFENYFKRWEFMSKIEIDKNRTSISNASESSEENELVQNRRENNINVPETLYQQKVKESKDKKKSAGRWTSEGFERYNELLTKVKESRNKRWRQKFEEDLQQMYVDKADRNLNAYNRRKRKMDEENAKKSKVKPMNMLDVMTL